MKLTKENQQYNWILRWPRIKAEHNLLEIRQAREILTQKKAEVDARVEQATEWVAESLAQVHMKWYDDLDSCCLNGRWDEDFLEKDYRNLEAVRREADKLFLINIGLVNIEQQIIELLLGNNDQVDIPF